MASHNRQEEAFVACFKIHCKVQVYGTTNPNQTDIQHKMKSSLYLGNACYNLFWLEDLKGSDHLGNQRA